MLGTVTYFADADGRWIATVRSSLCFAPNETAIRALRHLADTDRARVHLIFVHHCETEETTRVR